MGISSAIKMITTLKKTEKNFTFILSVLYCILLESCDISGLSGKQLIPGCSQILQLLLGGPQELQLCLGRMQQQQLCPGRLGGVHLCPGCLQELQLRTGRLEQRQCTDFRLCWWWCGRWWGSNNIKISSNNCVNRVSINWTTVRSRTHIYIIIQHQKLKNI